jgi:DNA-binding XRE family transcriptional regulator
MAELKPAAFRLTRDELAKLRRTPAPALGRNKIQTALDIKDIRQHRLAAVLGVKPSTLSELVTGVDKDVMLEATARRIANLFGACIEDIFPPACATRRRAA